MNDATAGQPMAGQPIAGSEPTSITSSGPSALSTEQTKFVSWLKEDHSKGLLSDAQLDLSLREVTGQGIEQLKADTRTPSQIEYDAAHPPTAANDYIFPRSEDPDHITPEMTAFNKTARNWLATGMFPKGEGSYLATEVVRLAEQMDGWNDAQHEQFQKNRNGEAHEYLGRRDG